MENYLVENMSCFEILEKDWEIMNKEIKIKEIPNIHIFLDNIFHELIIEINNQKTFKSEKDLTKFEKNVENIIRNELNNKNSINNYIENRNKYLDIEPNEEFAIIMEEEIYNGNWNSLKNKYPELEYFIISKLPSFEDFKKEFNYLENNKDKYPIINIILNKDSEIKYLKYLPKINELCNYMINYCSYKFTRDEAKKKLIKEEIKDKEELINEFMNIFDELRKFVEQYECHNFNINKDDKLCNSIKNEKNQYLSYFCVDIGEFNYGMVLASIYKKMIFWQNSFINQVLYSENESHKKYKELFKNEIMIQDCNQSDIIILPSPDDLMQNYILKNSYKKKYGIIDYNFQLIEEELASEILPNIKKFISDNDKCLKYVIYQYEGFRGNKDNIITIFNEKFKRKELTKDEAKSIINYLNNHEKKETKKILDFWFCLQILIDIILENNYNGDIFISTVINENNKNGNLDILNEFFNKEDNIAKNFKVNSMMSIFDFFEFICWDKIKENLSNTYLKDINNDIKNKINDFFKNKNNKIITKMNLSKAIRRFVSRYLSGKRGENEINENNNFIYYLCKEELWDQKDIVDNPEFDRDLSLLFDTDKSPTMISVGQAAKVYEYLGGEMQLYLNDEKEDKGFLQKFDVIFGYTKELLSIPKKLFNKKDNYSNNNNENEDDINDIERTDSNKSSITNNSRDSNASNNSSSNDEERSSHNKSRDSNKSSENEEDNDLDY